MSCSVSQIPWHLDNDLCWKTPLRFTKFKIYQFLFSFALSIFVLRIEENERRKKTLYSKVHWECDGLNNIEHMLVSTICAWEPSMKACEWALCIEKNVELLSWLKYIIRIGYSPNWTGSIWSILSSSSYWRGNREKWGNMFAWKQRHTTKCQHCIVYSGTIGIVKYIGECE